MYIYVETNKQINKFCLKEGMIGTDIKICQQKHGTMDQGGITL